MTPEQIRVFLGGLLPFRDRRKLVGMFTAYFDESGSEDSGRVFTVSCLVAPANVWATFSGHWEAAMERGGAKDRTLHMKNLIHGLKGKRADEDFEGWTELDRRKLFRKLIPLLRKHTTFSMSVSVSLEAFNRHVRTLARKRSAQLKPLGFCMQECLERIEVQMGASESKPVACIFHQHQKSEADTARQFYILQAAQRWEATFPTFTTSPARGFPPIQAADMVAYEVNRFQDEQRVSPTGRDTRMLYREIISTNAFHSHFWGEEELTDYSRRLVSFLSGMPREKAEDIRQVESAAQRRVQRERDPKQGELGSPRRPPSSRR